MFLWEIDRKQVTCSKQRRVLLPELRKIATDTPIKSRRMAKADLAKQLQRHYAALRIWIAWKARHWEPDPITLERPEPPLFTFFQSNGKPTVYTARVLINYLLTANRLVEPLSNTEFSKDQLQQLDQIARDQRWNLPSLAQRHNAPRSSLQSDLNFVLELELFDRAERLAAHLPTGNFFPFLGEFASVYLEFRQRDPAAARLGLAAAIEKLRISVNTEHPNTIAVLSALYEF